MLLRDCARRLARPNYARQLGRVISPAAQLSTRADTWVDTNCDTFKANAAAMEEQLAELRRRTSLVHQGGGGKAVKTHRARGKLMARERIEALIDPGSPFLEFSALAGDGLYEEYSPPAGGIVTGIGSVHGRQCVIVANDPTVKGGTYFPITVKKRESPCLHPRCARQRRIQSELIISPHPPCCGLHVRRPARAGDR